MGARFIPEVKSSAILAIGVSRKQLFTNFRSAETAYLQKTPTMRGPGQNRYSEPMQPHFDVSESRPDNLSVHYSRAAMLFHWSIAALVLFEFATALSFRLFNPGEVGYVHSAYRLHMSSGMTLLVASLSCVVWRLLHAYPPLPRDMNAITRALAKSAHISLYVFIIVVPLTGWLILSARNSPVGILGNFHWPQVALISHSDYSQRLKINDTLMPIHAVLSYAGMCLVALHVLASLYHHFWRGDEVLTRMLPRKEDLNHLNPPGLK
jgi:cytochrome b561